ncbi:MAG: CopD family protein [Chloroflexota bacterium]
MMTLLKRLGAFALVIVLFGLVQPAAAHGYIVRAIPENRAVLERPPTRLQYWFSEALEREFSVVNLRDQQGDILATGGLSENDNTLMVLRVPNDLPDGAYIVELRPAFASDGHVVAESRVFFVGEEIGGVAGAGQSDQAIPLEVAWRTLVIASTILLFSTLTVYSLVLVPAWGSDKYAAGLLPPRVMRRLNVIVGYALLGVFVGNGLALIQQTMVFFNIGFTQALDPDFFGLVRVGSRFGDIWNWRMMFLGGIGVMFLLSLTQRENQPQSVRAYWVASAWLGALVLGSHSVLSHAAGSLLWPWVGITVDWLHLLGVGFWAGGLAVLVLVLPVALRPYEGEARRMALLAALRRFSRVALVAAAVVVTSGIYSASNWIYGPDEVTTTFGGTLFLKVTLVAALLALGGLHHIALQPERFARLERLAARVRGFMPTLRLEAGAAVAVLGAASLLSATPVPVPAFAQQEVQVPTQALDAAGLTVVMSIIPGGPGVNTHDTIVTRGGQRVEDVSIQLVNVHPASDTRSDPHVLEQAEPGLYVTATADIETVGRWWSLLDITLPDGQQHRLAFDWDISAEAAVIQSINPNLANLLALTAVVLASMMVLRPFAQRLFGALNLDAGSVTIAVTATALTAVALIVGYVVVQQQRQTYQETLNPPPQVINAVLPTQTSLERGERLYTEHCIGWQAQPRDFNALRDRLAVIRDEELYATVSGGWRNLPPCTGDLSLYQRWDIVNYLRTLARPT